MGQLQLVIQKLCIRLTKTLPPREGGGGRSILVTSAHRREGRTFVASGLAVQLAKLGSGNVLLVDGDFEHPELARKFRLPESATFSQSLRDDRLEEEAIYRSPGTNLAILAAGKGSDPALLFHQQRVQSFLDRARRCFDWIIFDSAAIAYSGGNSLTRLVDGIVLVVDSRQTRRQVVQDALTNIEIDRDKVLGVVLNKRKYEIPSFLYRWM